MTVGRGTRNAGPTRHVLVLNHFAVAPSAPGGTRHIEMFGRLSGWDFTLIAADRNLLDRRRHLSPEVVTVPTVPYRSNGLLRVINWVSYAVGATVRGLFAPAPEVVYASSPHLLTGLAGWAIARRHRAKFVFEVRDLWPDLLVSMGHLPAGSRLAKVLSRLEKWIYAKADRIVVLAEGSVVALADKGVPASKVVFLPNAADPEDFTSNDSRQVLRSRYGFRGQVFLYAGAHGPANGLEHVLRAAEELQVTDPEVEFVLVGDGPEKARLIAEADTRGLENIVFLPPVPKTEMPDLLAAADVGLHVLEDVPLFRYGISPNKLCDYLAAGKPVLTNSPGEAGDLVLRADAGVVTEPGGLVEGVQRLAGFSDSERSRMGESGRRYMAAHRNRTQVAEDLETMLDSLVGAPQSASSQAEAQAAVPDESLQ